MACATAKEILWLDGLLNEIGFINEMVRVYTNNHNAIHLGKNSIYLDRTKHIDIKFQYVRNMVEKCLIIFVKNQLNLILSISEPKYFL